jgi:Zn-dependent peptidase ImmA (M78 family)
MDYKKVIIPYLRNEEIEEKTVQFRERFWDGKIPIDIEYIVDNELKIDIIPIPNFLKLIGIDSLFTPDWKSLYVDHDEYMDERRHNRLRFSLAHEVGHFILHKRIYEAFGIKTREDYQRFYKDIPELQYRYLEGQANKFANYLLIPRKVLAIKTEEELENNPSWLRKMDRIKLDSYLAIPLSKIFKVSEEAVRIALNDINL